jgi:hypothetical protein
LLSSLFILRFRQLQLPASHYFAMLALSMSSLTCHYFRQRQPELRQAEIDTAAAALIRHFITPLIAATYY